MKKLFALGTALLLGLSSCQPQGPKSAKDILGDPDYLAIAYGGYREQDRSVAPSVDEIKEDLKILNALGIRILRTYHARLYEHTPRLLQAIEEMQQADPEFEMYVMLGAWMQCENAWTPEPNHNKPDTAENEAEILQAIKLAKRYPEIVKVLAVGNESMVHWAAGYYVHPRIILKEVLRLQELKLNGELPADLWITSSDNFASWGGGDESYHLPALDSLISAVDYLSVHSYPFHDTHYHPDWWWVPEEEDSLPKFKIIESAVMRGVKRVESQVSAVKAYVNGLGLEKSLHIGETGWASFDNHLYSQGGSGAADEYKEMLYHQWIRAYCESESMACFYFEAFDEPWKDGDNPNGSENHFGLITVNGQVKMPLWPAFDEGLLEGLSRAGQPLRKTLDGNPEFAIGLSSLPPRLSEQPSVKRNSSGQILAWAKLDPNQKSDWEPLELYTLNAWEGSCQMESSAEGDLVITGGSGDWWGGALASFGPLDLSDYEEGYFEILVKGDPEATFELGFQSGNYEAGTQKDASISLGANGEFKLRAENFISIKIPMQKIKAETNLKDVQSPLYIKGLENFQGAQLRIRKALFSK